MVFWRSKSQFDEAEWVRLCSASSAVGRLTEPSRERLRGMAEQFIRDKSLEGCGGFSLNATAATRIAVFACLPVLELGLGSYRGVKHVLVYPDEFRSKWSLEDEHGVVSDEDRGLSGEAWFGGPVVLSWADIQNGVDGYNVVIHEFAHKLDMLTGEEDGVPPLPAEVDRRTWVRDFGEAREDLRIRELASDDLRIDPYASENPAEGFAVFSEAYFEIPEVVEEEYPKVFAHLRGFYRV